LIDLDYKALEQDCKKIVQEISGRFIELGLDDHHSDYGQELQAKQIRFMREF